MIEKKRVVQSDTIKNQRGKMFKNRRRCRMKLAAEYLLDYQTAHWRIKADGV